MTFKPQRLLRALPWVVLPAITVAMLSAAPNGEPTKLLRSPAISATQIAFAYANNIWVVERAGGNARRLTSFQGTTSNPHFSPDGRTLAFTGDYAGNTDVYTVPVDGGEPKRLTWHPGGDTVQGWTPDGKSIVFASGRASWAPPARRASGRCRPTAASSSRCRCRAPTRARSRPTARRSPTA